MADALVIADDFDASELRLAIESAFNIRFGDEDTLPLETLGDLHSLIASKVNGAEGAACLNLMAFLRLRRALLPSFRRKALRSETQLEALANGSPRMFVSGLAHATGLAMPEVEDGLSRLNGPLFLLMLPVTILLASMQQHWLTVASVPIVTLSMMAALDSLDAKRFPERWATLGDLARAVSNLNPAVLAAQGGRLDDQTIWQALEEIVRPYASSETKQVTRETKLAA